MKKSIQVEIQAHRGNQHRAKENTLAAFSAAVDFADGIEMDVQITKDNIPIIHHDFAITTKEGISNSKELIKNIPHEDLKKIKAGKDIPTLIEVLDWFDRHHRQRQSSLYLNIELKRDPTKPHLSKDVETITEIVVKTIKNSSNLDKIMFCSFDPSLLLSLKKKLPQNRLAYLFDYTVVSLIRSTYRCDPIDHILHFAKHASITALSLDIKSLEDKKILKKLQGSGMSLLCWTVNDSKGWEQSIKASVNTIITDIPEELRKFLEEKNTLKNNIKKFKCNLILFINKTKCSFK